tara:strand:+ start:490 stop:828 length:339 start_codon:yes stop_codon:yes gene_type:complete
MWRGGFPCAYNPSRYGKFLWLIPCVKVNAWLHIEGVGKKMERISILLARGSPARFAQDVSGKLVHDRGNEAFGVRAMTVLGLGALLIAAATLANFSVLLHFHVSRPLPVATF